MRSPVSSPAAAASAAAPPPPLRPPALRLPLLDEAFAREPLLCLLKAEFDGWAFRVGCLALEGLFTDLGPAERSDRACDEDPRSRLDAPRSRPVLTRAGVSFCGLSIPDTPSNCCCGGRLALAASSRVRASPPPCDRAASAPPATPVAAAAPRPVAARSPCRRWILDCAFARCSSEGSQAPAPGRSSRRASRSTSPIRPPSPSSRVRSMSMLTSPSISTSRRG